MQRERLTECYSNYFGANNAFLVVAGDVEELAIEKLVTDLFGGGRRLSAVSTDLKTPNVGHSRRVGLVEKEAAVQSAIRVGHVGIPRNSANYVPVTAMNMALGGYFGSRINLNLREKHGFTYGARSYFDTRLEAGPFIVSTEVRTDVTVRAIEEIVNELTAIVEKPIADEELAMVKNYMIGSFPLQLETPQQVASRVATIELYGLEPNYFDTYRDKLAALTKDDLYHAAQSYVKPEDLVIVASGDVPALKEGMADFGPVAIYDADANQLS
jgi:zinc protease